MFRSKIFFLATLVFTVALSACLTDGRQKGTWSQHVDAGTAGSADTAGLPDSELSCMNACERHECAGQVCGYIYQPLVDPDEDLTMVCEQQQCLVPFWGYCNSDADCSWGDFGPFCLPSPQGEEMGYFGLCQNCLKGEEPEGCEEPEVCIHVKLPVLNEFTGGNMGRDSFICYNCSGGYDCSPFL